MLTPISNTLYDLVVKVAVNQHNNELKKTNKNNTASKTAEKNHEDNAGALVPSGRDSTSTESIYNEKSKQRE